MRSTVFAVNPCLSAFIRDFRFPSSVRGPVLFWAFRIALAIFASDAMMSSPIQRSTTLPEPSRNLKGEKAIRRFVSRRPTNGVPVRSVPRSRSANRQLPASRS
jgi:hypothetical protein